MFQFLPPRQCEDMIEQKQGDAQNQWLLWRLLPARAVRATGAPTGKDKPMTGTAIFYHKAHQEPPRMHKDCQ